MRIQCNKETFLSTFYWEIHLSLLFLYKRISKLLLSKEKSTIRAAPFCNGFSSCVENENLFGWLIIDPDVEQCYPIDVSSTAQ